MKKKNIAVVFGLLATFFTLNGIFFVAASSGDASKERIWAGVLKIPNGPELRIAVEIFKKADGTLAAAIHSPDQGVAGVTVDDYTLKDGNARFVVSANRLVIEGKLSNNGLSIEGEFKQGKDSFPLVLKPVDELPPFPPRKQDPRKPFPYDEEDVVFKNSGAGVMLSGTLTVPRSGGRHPAVLLVAGSGPNDRRGTGGLGHFNLLADYLTRQGFAVLRYDKRGIMRSTGNYSSATSRDFAADALAGLQYLNARADIDSKAVGLIGHSEGAFIAALVAAESPDVGFIVTLAGTGINHYDLMVLQDCADAKAKGLSDADIEIMRNWSRQFYAIAKLEKDSVLAAEKMKKMYAGMTDDEKRVVGADESKMGWTLRSKNALAPWFREFIAFDPQPILRKISCPVLALIGSKDVQVTPKENLRGIDESLKAAGNRNYVVKEIPDLNHLFQTAKTGSPNEYGQLEETISPAALEIISSWLHRIVNA